MSVLRVLKNFKVVTGKNQEEFTAIDVRWADTEVFVDLPVCIVPFGVVLSDPMLYKDEEGRQIAIERSDLIKRLEENPMFHLVQDKDGGIREAVAPEKAQYSIRLPKGIDLSEYMIVDGRLVKRPKVEPDVPVEGESKPEVKKVVKKKVKPKK